MDYDGTGGMRLYGCADFLVIKRYATKFAIGTKAYILAKSRKGKVEWVVIKKVNVVDTVSTYSGAFATLNYVDTFNRVWLENELIYQGEAVQNATDYLENYARQLELLLQSTCST